MLSENIKSIHENQRTFTTELAVKLNVVRQTVSKGEQGRSVPDSDMLISYQCRYTRLHIASR